MKTVSSNPSSFRLAKFIIVSLAGFFFALVGPSCGSKHLLKNLEKQQNDISRQTTEAGQRRLSPVSFSWKDAVARLDSHNLSLASSRKRIEQQELQMKQRWRSFLPAPFASVSLQTSLFQLGDLTSDDVVATLAAPLRIPNPINERSQTIQQTLQLVQARDSYRQRRRRLILSLYTLFEQWDALEQGEEGPETTSSSNLSQAVEQLVAERRRKAQLEQNRESLYNRAADLLNLPGSNPRMLTHTLPQLDYSDRLDEFEPGKNYGRLAVRMASYELEASILRLKGIKVAQWPRFSNSLSTPQLFNSRNSDSNQFDVDQISLFSGLNKTFDVSGQEARSIKTAEDNIKFVRARLRLRIDREAREWRKLKKTYHNLKLEKRLLDGRLQRLRSAKVSSQLVSTAAAEIKRLNRQLVTLDRSKNRLDQQIWMWDDSAWKEE